MTERSVAAGASRPVHRLNPLIQLYWRQFDEHWVLFEALSGQTHQMSSVTAAVLMCYEASPPLSSAALLAALGSDFGLVVDVTQAAQVLAVVDQLSALGLIVPVNDHVSV